MRPLSLRAHLVIGATFWMVGMFGLAMVVWHVTLGNQQPPRLFRAIHQNTHVFGLICVTFLAAGFFQVRRGWRSINQLRARLQAVRDARDRRLGGVYPSEVEPLVLDLNALLDQRDEMVGRARTAAADLAHGLKTPLAVLTREAVDAAASGHPELAQHILDQVERMRRQVEYQLTRSRVDASRHRAPTRVSIRASIEGLERTLARLYANRGVSLTNDVDLGLDALVEREDLDEILGNLLDNAYKWARQRCQISARHHHGRVTIIVEDDGPGLPSEMRTRVVQRGVRADEAVPGTGLGLSIARELTEAYGGTVVLDDSPLGGLRVTIDVPAGTQEFRRP